MSNKCCVCAVNKIAHYFRISLICVYFTPTIPFLYDYWNVKNFEDAINEDNGYEWKLPKDI